MKNTILIIAAVLALCSVIFSEEVTVKKTVSSAVEKNRAEDTDNYVWLKKKLSRSHTCSKCGNVDSDTDSLFWLFVGFIGQLVFTCRFLVQWIKSERRKQSYIPHVFWYLSIVGSVLLLLYAISIKAWPIILGQAFGVIVYGRNLALIAREKNSAAAAQAAENNSAAEDNQQN